MDAKKAQRRHDLDWLTVLGFSLVFLYHTTRFFDGDWWHIKNDQVSPLVESLKAIFDLWGMPLLFMLSGASVWFALRPGSSLRFLRDRILRLLVPLAFGIIVFGPPQVYLTRVFHGEFQGSFPEFLPLYFADWSTWSGNFAWTGVHLWYLAYLFLFTITLLPLFLALKSATGRRFTDWLSSWSARTGGIYLWALPYALLLIAFDPLGILHEAPSEDVNRLIAYPLSFVYGFLVLSAQPVQQAIIRQRRISLALALVLTLGMPLVVGLVEDGPSLGVFVLAMVLVMLLSWSYLLAIFGFGMRYLTSDHRLLAYAREAVLPFYILHQPVILILGSFIIPLALPIVVKWLLIAPAAFGISLAVYEFVVRRVNPLRWLFGLKTAKGETQAVKARRPALNP